METEIIDADKFVLTQVYRPYQTMLGLRGVKLNKQLYNNEKTIQLLKEDTEWALAVKNRIKKCNFKYSQWIKHPVIDYLKSLQELNK